jgi:hypothetical protein
VTWPKWDLLPVGTEQTPTADDCIHLFLTICRVIVLRSLSAGGQLKLIDPKTRDPELIGQRTKHAM